MNVQIPRERLERFGRLVAEHKRREQKRLQSQRGWYDEDGVRQGGLMAFIRYYWHVLEPEAELVEGWALYAIVEHLEAVTFGEVLRLLMTVPPGFMKSLCTDVFWPSWEWGPMNKAHKRFVAFSYSASLTERDNERFRDLLIHESYQALWRKQVRVVKVGATKVTNTRKGWKLASSVGGVGTGERGDVIVLDDAHNIKEAESETVRNETIRWFRESMSDRLNNLQTGAIVVIMQRSHEDDVAGCILSLGLPYCHLMIPMEYDWDRQTDEDGEPRTTEIGWFDPRYVAGQPDECDGTLAWVERFPPHEVGEIRTVKGPYAYCTPRESPVLMADLSLKPIGDIKVGDRLVGFEVGDNARRARHKPCEVVDISKSVRPVVRLTLDSGQVVRCTADHRWFTGRNDKSHQLYASAKMGSRLRRVCPDVMPTLSIEEARSAGWVSGFYDGEGSIGLMRRRPNDPSDHGNCLITFHQTSQQNLPLCEKLELSLDQLGFAWGMQERVPTTLSAAGVPWQRRRSYYLKSDAGKGVTRNGGAAKRASRLTLYQRFLHIVQPTKWRDRLIQSVINGRMFTTTERVVLIEPDGVEPVYGLTTTTGNYVVWGLASSNSGQYQQTPTPRGGGIFKREWWQLWEPPDGKFPVFELLIASLDSAFTENTQNDPSGLTVWGIFLNEERQRRIMLVHAWRKHLQFSGPRIPQGPKETPQAYKRRTQESWGLMEWVSDTCNRFKVDRLLIEAKASGISAAQELQNRFGLQDWSVQLCPVKGDKVARALACQPTFSQMMVYAPAREWAEEVITEMATFPRGKFDDLTDSATQAVKYLRGVGLAQTDEESRAAELAQLVHKPKPRAIYPV